MVKWSVTDHYLSTVGDAYEVGETKQIVPSM